MPSRKQLQTLDFAASYFPCQTPKPAQSATFEGVSYQVQYNLVHRKCFDAMPTPTACYKINGKRVSRAVFYSAAL